MFITSEDHRFFSKLSSDDHEDFTWAASGGSSSSSEDDRRAAAIQGSSGSFADSVGLLPALPETSSSSSDFSSPEDDLAESEEEDNDRVQLYPKIDPLQNRMGLLRRSALGILTGARRRTVYSDSSESPSKNKNRKSIPDNQIQPSLSFPLPEPPKVQEVILPQDPVREKISDSSHSHTYPIVSSELSVLPVVLEEDDLQLSDRKSDDMMSQSSIEHVLNTATQNVDHTFASTSSSWDAYSVNSNGGGSRSRTKVERKKKKKSHRIPSSVQSSTLNHVQDEPIVRMEEELEARLHVIKHLKDTVVKQHEAMEQLSRTNDKLKAKLRIAAKSYKAAQARLQEDAERIQNLEVELKAMKLKIDQRDNEM